MSELETLLTFVTNFRDFHDEKGFFRAVDLFSKEQLQSKAIVVFSLPFGNKKNWNIDHCRIVWNKSRLDSKELPKEIFSKVVFHESGITTDKPVNINNEDFFVYFLGQEGAQELYLLAQVPENSILSRLSHHFAHFLRTGFDNMERYKEVRRLQSLVHIDDVTGLFNQRKLYKDLDESILRHETDGESFYVLFIDIDHFKKVNDGHGHLVGTRLLVEVAKLMQRTLRETDLIYRYGGDEYVLILPGATDEVARMVGKRMLKAIKEHPFNVTKDSKQPMHLSVSIGLAGYPMDAKSRDDILDIADRMMYQAKESGRGRVCHAGELLES
ncbi:MAG: hypothetical protein COW01_12285 [Bdellovibrionales bacterium CG12_big_fil_rev_8_21_14_0_65_38_15]|nr:MAG: hypothetical protein COW79_00955 [Bdellovibrionales bacterium CG22_combo_CG10-13_8_21_14_all_38_13]PIQ54109.1 MAG: hypothetical protein COW01_12285 [Bdellovibrionales bacterium CG12_big_fil_rev_8_21_14_0_65_38_15]PIR28786.1 MAG: hypothetical protein COV38_13850 [Bdellovibrionales bacterium CG11_big_fil_rev_8_21_14_0_20_38_13]